VSPLYALVLDSLPPIPGREQVEHARRAQAGDADAAEVLTRASLRYAVRVATQPRWARLDETTRAETIGMAVVDALRTFDPDRGFAWLTYFSFALKSRLRQAVEMRCREKNRPIVSLDEPGEFGRAFAEIVEDHRELDPCAVAIRREDARRVAAAIDRLDERAKRVAAAAYGIGRDPAKLREIGAEFGLGRAWAGAIRQEAEGRLASILTSER
jgi:DNA-directed RNA polymerase sigma subunit (sigma70/sigma32)